MFSAAEARKIVGEMQKVAMRFSATVVAPIYWPMRKPDGTIIARNGSTFFLQTSQALFGVTAAHVIEGKNSWREHCEQYGKTPIRISGTDGTSVAIDWDARCVDIDLEIDIATFMISPRELQHANRTIYAGLQNQWPPAPPKVSQGILYAGFPAAGTRITNPVTVTFGVAMGCGFVSSISETTVSSLIEREHLEPALGEGIPPENYNFGGISGGPMFYYTLTSGGLFLSSLAGVIFSGPNTSTDPNEAIAGFELIRARRTSFIRADGFLDRDLWQSCNF